jgi:hypothetical protein
LLLRPKIFEELLLFAAGSSCAVYDMYSFVRMNILHAIVDTVRVLFDCTNTYLCTRTRNKKYHTVLNAVLHIRITFKKQSY